LDGSKRQSGRDIIMKSTSTTRRRFSLIVGVILIPVVVMARSHLEHRSILDSIMFVTAMMLILGGVFYFLKEGSPNRRNRK